jgi:Ni,Fe-hydrogenase I large subunit
MIELIEKIEGEAKLNFSFEDEKIDFVDIEFMTARNIENILKGKSPLDALVINPRVCGICGHAHLIATVRALENCYDNIEISKKAEIIRELTLTFELIQNHFKWFYLTMRPLLGKEQEVLKATYPSQLMAKAIAVFGGQYPHTSYAIVGGVVCDVTEMDIIKVKHYIDETIKFFETNIVEADTKDFLVCDNVDKVFKRKGDLPDILTEIKKKKYLQYGKSYDRFIAFGGNSYFKQGKLHKTIATYNIFIDYVKEYSNPNSLAKNVMYKDKYYEVGPLARAMINKIPLVKDAHRRYGDNIFSRIIARVCEMPQLLNHSKELLEQLDLSEPSYIEPSIDITQVNGSGESAVEAARGSLIHKVDLENGVIKNYEIITPTQWNLGNGTKENFGVSQKAMIGLGDIKTAELVFKTFDVCSVCTTH